MPVDDQSLDLFFTVEPNLILFPHLPSYITSPSKGDKGFIVSLSKKVLLRTHNELAEKINKF